MQNTIEIDGKTITLKPSPRWTPDEDFESLEQLVNASESKTTLQPNLHIDMTNLVK